MKSPNVIVLSYHFPHYRGPALEAIRNTGASISYVGDLKDPYDIGVESWAVDDSSNFTPLQSRQLLKGKPLLRQPGAFSFVRDHESDVVIIYGHVYFIDAWFIALYCKFRNIPCLNWTHGWRKKEHGLKNFIRKSFFKLYTGLIVFSEESKEIAVSEGFQADDIYVVYNSLDVPRQEEIYNRLTNDSARQGKAKLFANNAPVVVCIGRLTPEREVALLIDACKLLQDKGKPVNLLIIGKGPELNTLKEQARHNNVEALFPGAVYDEEEIAGYFLDSDLTVSPGSIGLLVMHSFIYGVPVISHGDEPSQKPEWQAIEPGVNGDYFVKGSAESLAEKIQEWVFEKNDTDDIAEKCRQTVLTHYNPAYQTKVFDQAITEAITRKKK